MKPARWILLTCCVVGSAGCGPSTTHTQTTTSTTLAGEKTTDSPPVAKPSKEGSKQERIIGTWEVVRSDEEMTADTPVPPKGATPPKALPKIKMPPKATVEFTKDHKMKIRAKAGDQTIRREGTYEVNDDKLTTVEKTPDGKDQTDTVTIVLLTDTRMIIKSANANVIEFRKK